MSNAQVTFYPPTLIQPFADASPPTKSQTSGDEAGYFRNYRVQTLSKFSIPRYEWSSKSVGYAPKPEVAASARRRKIDRDLFLTPNDVSSLDPNRMREVDDLYKASQIHRSQYKDRSSSFHPLFFFKPDDRRFRCAPGFSSSYFAKYRGNYVQQKVPTVSALGERRTRAARIPDLSLSGIYDRAGCVAYKR